MMHNQKYCKRNKTVCRFGLFFGKNFRQRYQKLTDVQAVKGLSNLVQLNVYEKPFHPEISGGIREMLFENMSQIAAIIRKKKMLKKIF